MKFQIENIGTIRNAEIEVDGITIIAGENNVGKSTVGKTMYALLNDMSIWKRTYDNICSMRIDSFLYQQSSSLEDWCMRESGAKRRRTSKTDQLRKMYSKNEEFLVAIEDYQITEDEKEKQIASEHVRIILEEYCYAYIGLYAKNNIDNLWHRGEAFISEWTYKVVDNIYQLELDELKIQTEKIMTSFEDVFEAQFRKIGTDRSGIVFIDDTGRTVRLKIYDAGEEVDQPIRISNRIFFVESPKIYDFLSNHRMGHVQKEYLRYLMSPNIFKKERGEFKREIIEEERKADNNNIFLTNMSSRLVKVMGGRAEFLQKVGLEFKDENISESIHAVNVSTGLKALALLEYALRIGAIEDGDILVLDEPEINLHPEWQVEYAKALVELQKEFHLKLVITTHSPYFMRAIECYTDVNDCMDRLNVYRVSKNKEDNETSVVNVSYSEYGMSDLYDELSAPFEALENLLN